jgi:hypothetical protein
MMPHIDGPLDAVDDHLVGRPKRSLIRSEGQYLHILPPAQEYICPRLRDIDQRYVILLGVSPLEILRRAALGSDVLSDPVLRDIQAPGR